MSDQIPGSNRDLDLYKKDSAIKRFRKKAERLEEELGKAQELLGKYASAYKQMKEDPRMQVPIEQFQQMQEMTRNLEQEQTWQSHESQFESALKGLTAEGVTAKKILRAVGYDPTMVQELTPELIRDVLETAYAEYPQLFSVPAEPPQGDQAEPSDPSLPGQLTQDFAALSQRQQQNPGPISAPVPTAQAVPNGYVPPPQPVPNQGAFQQAMNAIPGMQQAPNPALQFRGFGDFQGRGGPAPSKSPVVAARLRDPAWLAANQGALARAVAEGANVVDAPE